jgi:hypothetical protein
MIIGSLAVNITANVSKFTSNLRSAQTSLGRFVKSVNLAKVAIGSFVAASAARMVANFVTDLRETLSSIDQIAKAAGRLGMTTEQMSGLAHAAQMNNVQFNDLVRAMTMLQKNAGHSDILKVADEIAGIANPAQRAARAMELFGRSGAELLPLLQDGSGGIQALMADAERLGITFTKEQGVMADAADDAMTRIGAAANGLKMQLAIGLAPAVTEIAEAFASWLASFKQGQIGDTVSNAIGQIGDVIHKLRIGLAKMQEVFLRTLAVLTGAAQRFITDVVSLVNKLPGVNVSTPGLAGTLSEEFDRAANEAQARFNNLLISKTPSQRLADARQRLASAATSQTSAPAAAPAKLPPLAESIFKKIGFAMAQGAGIPGKAIGLATAGLGGALPSFTTKRQPELEALVGGTREAFIASRENLRPHAKANDPAHKTAKATQTTAEKMETLIEAVKEIGSKVPALVAGAIGG